MGYELKLFVVRKGYGARKASTERIGYFCQVFAMVELGKCCYGGPMAKLNALTPEDTERDRASYNFFFAPGGDGNTAITHDPYDEVVRERSLVETLAALKAHREYQPVDYNVPAAIALLEVMFQRKDAEDLRVLCYGN